MRVKKEKKNSIFKKIFFPILCLMVLQSIVIYVFAVYGGIVDSLNENAKEILTERVINREKDIEVEFNNKWANTSTFLEDVNSVYNKKIANNKNYSNDISLQKNVMSEISPILIKMLRSNNVNGVFIIFNDSKEYKALGSTDKTKKYGLCIRDYDQNSIYRGTNDLLTFRCPSSIVTKLDCPLDSGWEALYSFDADHPGDFFYNPLKAAYDNEGVESDNLAYLSGLHNFGDNDRNVVSYSWPLIDKNGFVYAVLGIELTETYLSSLLPSEELYGNNAGSYILAKHVEDTDEYSVVANDGALYQRVFGGNDKILSLGEKNGLIKLKTDSRFSIHASISEVSIYNDNTPFEDEQLYLLGIVETDALFSVGNNVKKMMSLLSLITLAIGFVGIYFVSKVFAEPIKSLAEKVKAMSGKSETSLDRLNIYEIDELVNSIENLSKTINQNKVRSEFFSRMSHDMRTPMNAIIGFSSKDMISDATEKEKDEYLEKINSSGKYLLELINEVLDMTKISSNKMELSYDLVSLASIYNDTLPIIDEVAKQKGVKFDVSMDDESVYVYMDKPRINQVIVNLLSNAVKFTPENGEVSFIVKTINRTENELTQEITVKDSGIGMSKDFQEKLYEPFVQEYISLEGTGLGLSITKKIIELMGGSITCKSEKGLGTTFVVRLSYKLQNVEKIDNIYEETANEETSKIVSRDLSGKRLLLVEDHPINIQVAKKLIEKKGIIVDCAVNGKEAVDLFKASDVGYYSYIIMDIRMPVMGGLEATKTIRGIKRSDAQIVPIIAMTANAFSDDIKASSLAGMNAHLSKPVEPERLYEVLNDYADIIS